MASLSAPSIFTVRSALEQIEGAIRLEPLPEDIAPGKELGIDLGGTGPEYTEPGSGPPDDSETEATSEGPAIVFEVPPKVTDAEVVEALGEGSGELARLFQIKGTDALGWYVTFHQRAAQHGIYLPMEGIVELALSSLGRLALPLDRRLEIAFHAILRHEPRWCGLLFNSAGRKLSGTHAPDPTRRLMGRGEYWRPQIHGAWITKSAA